MQRYTTVKPIKLLHWK